MADRELRVVISGDASSLKRAFGQVERQTQTTSQKMIGAFKNVAPALGAAVAAVAVIGGKELIEQEQVLAQTEARLKSTGAVANVTADDVAGLANELGHLSGVDAEVIQSGENVLLTFTKVRNEIGKGNNIFDRATRAALDMSVALGSDLQSSVLQLGKALNDPIKGMTALRRAGVMFTAEQQDQVAALMESGELLKAQKIILGELQTEFGGAAKAAGDTLGGQLGRLKNASIDAAAALVSGLAPAIETSAGALEGYADLVTEAMKATEHEAESLEASKRLMSELAEGVQNGTVTMERYKSTVESLTLAEKDWWNAGGVFHDEGADKLTDHTDELNRKLEEGIPIIQSNTAALDETGSAAKGAGKKIVRFAGMTGTELDKWAADTGENFNLVKGKLGDLADKHKVTADDIIGSFKRALKAQRDFGENWQTVADRAGTKADDFLATIQEDYGAQAPGIIEALANANDAQFKKIITMWNTAQGEVDDLTTSLYNVPTNITTTHTLLTSGTVAAGTLRGKATGGYVEPRGTYLVGEKGPEILQMGARSGNITPNHELSSGGGTTIHIHTDGTQDGRKVAQIVRHELESDRKRNARFDRTRGN